MRVPINQQNTLRRARDFPATSTGKYSASLFGMPIVVMRRLFLLLLCWWGWSAVAFSAVSPTRRPTRLTTEPRWVPHHHKPYRTQRHSTTRLNSMTIALRGGHFLQTSFVQFAQFIGKSKLRCFAVLLCSIVLESYASSLSKAAKDAGSVLLFVRAVCIYVFWSPCPKERSSPRGFSCHRPQQPCVRC